MICCYFKNDIKRMLDPRLLGEIFSDRRFFIYLWYQSYSSDLWNGKIFFRYVSAGIYEGV